MILIFNGICQYEGKYAVLNKNVLNKNGLSPSVISGKHPMHGNIYKSIQCCALDFSAKHARWWPRVLDFFPGFFFPRIKANQRLIMNIFLSHCSILEILELKKNSYFSFESLWWITYRYKDSISGLKLEKSCHDLKKVKNLH